MVVGVCGLDVYYFEYGRIGRFVVEKFIILGYECVGIVVVVGLNVLCLKVGDWVVIELGVICGCCMVCKEGCYNLCLDV